MPNQIKKSKLEKYILNIIRFLLYLFHFCFFFSFIQISEQEINSEIFLIMKGRGGFQNVLSEGFYK